MSVIGSIHDKYVFSRRISVLAQQLAELIPRGAKVLDVGCGDGNIARLLLDARPDIQIEGIDVLVRPVTHVPVTVFDGKTIPFADKSFDAVMFVDVLHHTDDPMVLLEEARRVAKRAVILKDHCRDGVLAGPTLRFMDWVGNARHNVVLPYNYWPESNWRDAFRKLGLTADPWTPNLGLYRWPFSMMFDRKLHFVTRLTPAP
ncbi:MAG: methylase involved in ubiquinone/menaquinone biosynthesis [Myxococcales bacterium]|nr:methylase involved in ubiquinone/menaquinone biosynthesis [Myxococcales bacterium]